MSRKKIKVICLDYDSAVAPKTAQEEIYDYNPWLNNYIEKLCDDPEVEQLVIVCFSARNDASLDAINHLRNLNGSVFEKLENYHTTLKSKLGDKAQKIKLSLTLAQDFYIGKETGYLWGRLRENKYHHVGFKFPTLKDGEEISFFHKVLWPLDETKVILWFIHAWDNHHQRDPAFDLEFVIFDDKEYYLQKISEVFNKNKQLMPPGTKTEFIRYFNHHADQPDEKVFICTPLQALTLINHSSELNIRIDIRHAATLFSKILKIESEKITTITLPTELSLMHLLYPSTVQQKSLVLAALPSTRVPADNHPQGANPPQNTVVMGSGLTF